MGARICITMKRMYWCESCTVKGAVALEVVDWLEDWSAKPPSISSDHDAWVTEINNAIGSAVLRVRVLHALRSSAPSLPRWSLLHVLQRCHADNIVSQCNVRTNWNPWMITTVLLEVMDPLLNNTESRRQKQHFHTCVKQSSVSS